jgi:two-component system response regulator CiaR
MLKGASPFSSTIRTSMDKKRILLIDDELMLLLSMQRMLDSEYQVDIAVGGKQALAAIDNNIYDLIICDINMPDVNGVDVYLYINKNHPVMEDRIIFMTGAILSDEITEFLTRNNNKCLPKPFESQKLLTTIKDFLV